MFCNTQSCVTWQPLIVSSKRLYTSEASLAELLTFAEVSLYCLDALSLVLGAAMQNYD